MYEISLTSQEKSSLEERHRKTRDVHEHDRIKAILLRSEGWTVSSIAQALRVHESTITRHVKDYLKNQKLNFSKGGKESLLSEAQTEALITHLSTTLYHHTHDIIDYIERRWNIRYSVPGLNKWLHRNGFSYKKPKGRPHKAEEQKQAEFIELYENLKSELSPNEKLLFIDATHPTQATKISYGWIRTGKTQEVSTTASRTRLNLIGAVDLAEPERATVVAYDTVNGESVSDFFEILRSKYQSSEKLHIVLDQAGYHRSEDLRKKAKSLNIELHYLPPYSPNLNPIERLWKVMNEHVRNNCFFQNARDFREQVKSFFRDKLPKMRNKLLSRINDNFERLKPAN